jgi:hypothetical protein
MSAILNWITNNQPQPDAPTESAEPSTAEDKSADHQPTNHNDGPHKQAAAAYDLLGPHVGTGGWQIAEAVNTCKPALHASPTQILLVNRADCITELHTPATALERIASSQTCNAWTIVPIRTPPTPIVAE